VLLEPHTNNSIVRNNNRSYRNIQGSGSVLYPGAAHHGNNWNTKCIFIVCTTSNDIILKISYKVLLEMENLNLKFIFNNKNKASRILTLFQTGSISILPTMIVKKIETNHKYHSLNN